MRSLLLALALLVATLPLHAADPAPDHLRLFLLIGQSNMAGRGIVEPQDTETHPRIFMLTKDLQWTLAKDPLHFDKPNIAGVGLGSEFARVLAKADPQAKIGLIPAAFGGTSIAQWKPGGALYKDAVARAREAMKSGTLAGILWHQGEADSAPAKVEIYADQFAAMIAQLRTDLDAPNVPLLVGELGRYEPKYQAFNEALPAVVAKVPHAALVSSEGLVANPDNVHFNASSLRKFGTRYAEAFLKISRP
ncbi:MAG TPA: sialate O-acetylesterase [Chthoniobacteraceae bacterium]|jgi:hypothetical protein|nr:sialate O-acetylesterase [Chthoniobacteraceae bacterium]